MVSPNFPLGLSIKPLSDESAAFETAETIETYGIAGRVWEAAYVLEKYITSSYNPSGLEFDPPFPTTGMSTNPQTLVEIGSGTGITSASIAKGLSKEDLVIATDLPEVCPLLEANLRSHLDHGNLLVRPLAWGNDDHAHDIIREISTRRSITHIVASDLVYFPELLAPLLRTLIEITTSTSPPILILSYKIRSLSKETPFWQAFGLWFTFEPVLARSTSDPGSTWERFNPAPDPTFIFIARRRQGSSEWILPEADRDLLDGVGAGGTPTKKGDDTFETLLFMSLQE